MGSPGSGPPVRLCALTFTDSFGPSRLYRHRAAIDGAFGTGATTGGTLPAATRPKAMTLARGVYPALAAQICAFGPAPGSRSAGGRALAPWRRNQGLAAAARRRLPWVPPRVRWIRGHLSEPSIPRKRLCVGGREWAGCAGRVRRGQAVEAPNGRLGRPNHAAREAPDNGSDLVSLAQAGCWSLRLQFAPSLIVSSPSLSQGAGSTRSMFYNKSIT